MAEQFDNRRFEKFGPTYPPKLIADCVRFLAEHDRCAADSAPLLTADGVVWIEGIIASGKVELEVPHWDHELRRLWLGDRLLKEYRQPSPNQTAILDAFQKENWVGFVVDPLPKIRWESKLRRKQRLHDTIKWLNRGLLKNTVQFHGDGSGRGILWKFFQENSK